MTINQDAINAAIKKLPKPAVDSKYLNDALDLIKQGKALVDPIGSKITGALNDMQSMAGSFKDKFNILGPAALDPSQPDFDPNSAIDSLISSDLFGGITDGIEKVASIGATAASMTSRMFTSIHPFEDRMDIPDDLAGAASGDAKKLGVPQLSTMFNVTASQQALDASLGRNQDNPCSSFMDTISGVIGSAGELMDEAKEFVGGIVDDVNGFIGEVTDEVMAQYNAIRAQIREQLSSAIDWVNESIDDIKGKISEAVGAVKGQIEEVMGGINEVIGNVALAVDDAIGRITDTIGEVIDAINETAAAIVEQVQAGFASMIKSLSSMNPCAQDVIIGENSVLTQDMSDLVRANMPPGSEIPF